MAILQVGGPNQVSYNNPKAKNKQVPFKAAEDNTQPQYTNKSNNNLLAILGLTIGAIACYVYRKPLGKFLGIGQEVAKAGEKAAENLTNTAAHSDGIIHTNYSNFSPTGEFRYETPLNEIPLSQIEGGGNSQSENIFSFQDFINDREFIAVHGGPKTSYIDGLRQQIQLHIGENSFATIIKKGKGIKGFFRSIPARINHILKGSEADAILVSQATKIDAKSLETAMVQHRKDQILEQVDALLNEREKLIPPTELIPPEMLHTVKIPGENINPQTKTVEHFIDDNHLERINYSENNKLKSYHAMDNNMENPNFHSINYDEYGNVESAYTTNGQEFFIENTDLMKYIDSIGRKNSEILTEEQINILREFAGKPEKEFYAELNSILESINVEKEIAAAEKNQRASLVRELNAPKGTTIIGNTRDIILTADGKPLPIEELAVKFEHVTNNSSSEITKPHQTLLLTDNVKPSSAIKDSIPEEVIPSSVDSENQGIMGFAKKWINKLTGGRVFGNNTKPINSIESPEIKTNLNITNDVQPESLIVTENPGEHQVTTPKIKMELGDKKEFQGYPNTLQIESLPILNGGTTEADLNRIGLVYANPLKPQAKVGLKTSSKEQLMGKTINILPDDVPILNGGVTKADLNRIGLVPANLQSPQIEITSKIGNQHSGIILPEGVSLNPANTKISSNNIENISQENTLTVNTPIRKTLSLNPATETVDTEYLAKLNIAENANLNYANPKTKQIVNDYIKELNFDNTLTPSQLKAQNSIRNIPGNDLTIAQFNERETKVFKQGDDGLIRSPMTLAFMDAREKAFSAEVEALGNRVANSLTLTEEPLSKTLLESPEIQIRTEAPPLETTMAVPQPEQKWYEKFIGFFGIKINPKKTALAETTESVINTNITANPVSTVKPSLASTQKANKHVPNDLGDASLSLLLKDLENPNNRYYYDRVMR